MNNYVDLVKIGKSHYCVYKIFLESLEGEDLSSPSKHNKTYTCNLLMCSRHVGDRFTCTYGILLNDLDLIMSVDTFYQIHIATVLQLIFLIVKIHCTFIELLFYFQTLF